MNWLKKLWRDKRGNALVIVGAALPLVIGSAGLASDTIQWVMWKRQLQRAADSAALAGVYAKVQNNNSVTPQQAVNSDLDDNNHAKPDLLPSSPTVSFPTSGEWTNGVRVRLQIQKTLGFSSLFMPAAPVITAEATAATIATGIYCVVSLIDTGSTGIKASGTADVDLGCGMITNSTSLTAAIATGTSKVTASPIAAVGDIKDSTNWGDAELLPFTVKQDDPFANVGKPKPDTSSCASSPPALNVQWNKTMPALPSAGATTCYSSMTLNGTVTLPSGTYIIDGGNLEFGTKANVTCASCTFVLTNQSAGSTATIGGIKLNASAEVKIHAPDNEANPYDGILIYQDRRATLGTQQEINGNSNSVMEGALYFPRQEIKINGTAGIKFTCAQFVAYVVDFAGTGKISNTCDDDWGDDAIMGRHVRLVA